MRTRKFWRRRSIITELLVPFTVLYFFWQRFTPGKGEPSPMPAPVICVGNVTVGGAGKTPVALHIAAMLKHMGYHPAFLTRGYGGKVKKHTPVKVDATHHSAQEVGDEPLLLAKIAPCYVCPDRVKAAQMAVAEGANVLIADDGMHNTGFHKDLTLVVVDGGYGFGNRLLLPAGPLRDRLDIALAKAQAAVLIGSAQPRTISLLNEAKLPLHPARLEAVTLPPQGEPYLAFAGIGLPEKFFLTPRSAGVNVVKGLGFPDHHPYTTKDIKKLEELAAEHNAKLITTEKDAVRLPADFRSKVEVLPVVLKLEDEAGLKKLLLKILKPR